MKAPKSEPRYDIIETVDGPALRVTTPDFTVWNRGPLVERIEALDAALAEARGLLAKMDELTGEQ